MGVGEEEEEEERKKKELLPDPLSHGHRCSHTIPRCYTHILHSLHNIRNPHEVHSLEASCLPSEELAGEFEGGDGQ